MINIIITIGQLLIPIFIIIDIIILILLIILKKWSIKFKGEEGEKAVARHLEMIDGHKYIFNNIMINDNGKSRQIDHIAVTEYGVYVIETKNYSGKILGKETSENWIQYLGNKQYRFKNPIHQNYGHTEIVKKILKDTTNQIFSIVVFCARCKLKVKTFSPVIYHTEVEKFITNNPKVLEKEKIEEINKIITENKIVNEETIKDHNYNVKKYVEYKNQKAEKGICPRCGGKLLMRNSKSGQFYGCSNFPKCRYTKSIE